MAPHKDFVLFFRTLAGDPVSEEVGDPIAAFLREDPRFASETDARVERSLRPAGANPVGRDELTGRPVPRFTRARPRLRAVDARWGAGGYCAWEDPEGDTLALSHAFPGVVFVLRASNLAEGETTVWFFLGGKVQRSTDLRADLDVAALRDPEPERGDRVSG